MGRIFVLEAPKGAALMQLFLVARMGVLQLQEFMERPVLLSEKNIDEGSPNKHAGFIESGRSIKNENRKKLDLDYLIKYPCRLIVEASDVKNMLKNICRFNKKYNKRSLD